MRIQRHRHVAQIPAEPPEEARGPRGRPGASLGPPAPVRKSGGPDLGAAVLGQGLPLVPGGAQELDVIGGMDGEDGVHPDRRGRLDRDAPPGQRLKETLGPLGQIPGPDHAAEAHVLLGRVQRLIGVVEGAHHRVPSAGG